MKKTVICFLLLSVFLSFASASSEWTTGNYLDDFGDKTEELYISSGTESGTFSGYSATDLSFNWQIRIDEYDITFILLDSAADYVKDGFTDSDITVTVRDDNGIDYSYDAYNSEKYNEIAVSDNLSLFRILAINKTPRIIIKITDSNYNSSIYKLGALDTTGLASLYKDAFGLDWSLPLSIELLPDKLELETDYSGYPSIAVNIYLGGEKIECWHTRTFAYSLTKEIGDDTGFLEEVSFFDPVTFGIDLSHIYLYNFSDNKEERSGYITVQIGEAVAQCLVSVVDKPIESEDSLIPIYVEEEQGGISENSDDELKETAPTEEIEDFELHEFYRGGEILIKATFTNTSGELVFNLDEDEVRRVIRSTLVFTQLFEIASYNLNGTLLQLTYPPTTEETIESYWQELKDNLNEYNEILAIAVDTEDDGIVISKTAETVKGTLNASIFTDRAEITIPAELSDEELKVFIAALIKTFPEIADIGTYVYKDNKFVLCYSESFSNRLASEYFDDLVYCINYWFTTEEANEGGGENTEKNSVENVNAIQPMNTESELKFLLRARFDVKTSIDYTRKTIEGSFQGTTKVKESDEHGTIGFMIDGRFFQDNNIFVSASVGAFAYRYSFYEENKEKKNYYNTFIWGIAVEAGLGVERNYIYFGGRIGLNKPFTPKYNESTSITGTVFVGAYIGELGFTLDYNVEEKRIRPQIAITLSIPICHVSKEKGSYAIQAF